MEIDAVHIASWLAALGAFAMWLHAFLGKRDSDTEESTKVRVKLANLEGKVDADTRDLERIEKRLGRLENRVSALLGAVGGRQLLDGLNDND